MTLCENAPKSFCKYKISSLCVVDWERETSSSALVTTKSPSNLSFIFFHLLLSHITSWSRISLYTQMSTGGFFIFTFLRALTPNAFELKTKTENLLSESQTHTRLDPEVKFKEGKFWWKKKKSKNIKKSREKHFTSYRKFSF
jgi:hypothetical protein